MVRLTPGGDGRTERPVTLWLPHDSEVIIHGATADAVVHIAPPDSRPRWVHHGSSISHSLEAPGPFGPWPQRVARDLDLNFSNLSFAGQAVLDQAVAQTMAAHPTDLITLKLGINVINCDGFSVRTFGPAVHGFLDTIRRQQPDTPIVLITAVACPIHEDTPGPTIAGPDGRAMALPRERYPRDGRLTLAATRQLIEGAVRVRDDERLFLLDGLSLFGLADAHHLRDNLHPDLEGNELIGERFVAIARDPASPLGRALTLADRGAGPHAG
ncbi:GDSL-type esterase/lipase family protein [Parafrigoribacterium soli]|uniref:GDSL-type esterase/lipase family protein n=1 Tax=Parafrigoribacterium soli TaxID=3144663 RepID=UPI0032EC7903